MQLGINIRTGSTYCGGWATLLKRLIELKPRYVRTVMPRTAPHGDFALFQQIHDALKPVFVLTAKLQPKDGITHTLEDIALVIAECKKRGFNFIVESANEFDNRTDVAKAAPAPCDIRMIYAPLEAFTRNLLGLCKRLDVECLQPSFTREYAPFQGFGYLTENPILNLHYYDHEARNGYFEKLRKSIEAAPSSRRMATEFGYLRSEAQPYSMPADVLKWELDKLKNFSVCILFELADSTAQTGFGYCNADGTPRAGWDGLCKLFTAA